MKQAEVRFYSELNDFVAPWRRGRATAYTFEVSGSVKDLIEALGVPHTEVDLVLANGESVNFSYRVKNDDRISVYPPFEAMDISALVRLRPQPLRGLRFVADGHLGGWRHICGWLGSTPSITVTMRTRNWLAFQPTNDGFC